MGEREVVTERIERRPDPLLDVLGRMIRHAHDSGRRPRRATLTVMDGGRVDQR